MSINIQTLGEIRKYISRELSVLYPAREVDSLINIIIKTLFNVNRLHQITEPGFTISDREAVKISEIVGALKSGMPIQYVIGETMFYDCMIKLNKNVLIPRQETEELVDIILKENRNHSGRILDIGTGSGCIAIALAKNLPAATVCALDISPEAIDTAVINAQLNEVIIQFLVADIFNPENLNHEPFDLVVSNPPYITEAEKLKMHKNVVDFEPHSALFVPDEDPLIYYRQILEQSGILLKKRGKIYFEINETMGDRLKKLMAESGYSEVAVIKDLNGKERIIKGTRYE